MRFLTFILAVYFVALMAVPCSDSENVCNTSETPVAQSGDTHEHHEDQDDSCAPFCFCNCCSVQLSVTKFNFEKYLRNFERHISEKIIVRDFILSSEFYANVWQPPKILA